MMEAPEIRKLKNGITLVLSEEKRTEAVSLIVFIGAGSRYESESNVGMTHFLEHMLFDGTEKRPTALDVTKEIDAIGADVNAHPSEEYTNFHIKAGAEHLEKIVEIFSDMLLNSKIGEDDIAKEKRVITEEIKMRTDIAPSYVFSLFDEAIFGGSTLGRNMMQDLEVIEKITRDDVVDFYKKFYLSNNVFISVCGNFAGKSADEIAQLIESKFTFPAGVAKFEKSLQFEQKKLSFVTKNSQQTNFIVGYYGCGYNSEDRIGLKLLSIILGGNMSSRLHTELREKRGLAYDVRTFSSSISDIGIIETVAGVADEKAGEALTAIIAEYEKVKNGVSDDELSMAKSYLLGQMKISFEDSNELGEFNLSQVFYNGKIETLSEISEKIAKITTDDIKKLANKYFDKKKLSVAVIAKESVRPAIEKVINNLGE
ncbi:MAG: pitrilysin family protein [Candidatus Berkelbacteria bacterium]|nr:pitrilysin family protein [Candidatus Berkelbacteria bacterium]